MNVGPPPNGDRLVSAAEIARMAGVSRAAVSNWRKRHPDFPAPVGGERNALFPLPPVRAWLDQRGKDGDTTAEVALWQALRDAYGDDMVRGLADVATLLLTNGSSDAVDARVRSLAEELAATSSPADVVAGLMERFTSTTGRPRAEVSTPRLVRAVRHFAGTVEGTVFDPACGIGSLLLAFGDGPAGILAGQDIDPAAARLAGARARLAGLAESTITVGDSLREDRWPDLRAALVVCDPPVNVPDLGREELLLDNRWEFGVATRAESELAWLQHCYAHVAPGGRAVVVMPASVAYRKAGRRIRAELVRRGVLTHVIALAPGMAAGHSQPVHLWLLARPPSPGHAVSSVRMMDLTASDPDGPLAPAPNQLADVPLIDLLDDAVDLTPAWHVAASRLDQLADYQEAQQAIAGQLRRLQDLLPTLAAGPGSLDGATITVADLARAGLVDLAGGRAAATSDQLDTDYLHGFLSSDANVRRSTSGSGSFRTDVRGSRIPQMSIDDQRRYGAAFRAVAEFEQRLRELTRLGERVVALTRGGLTSGGLRPPPTARDPGGDQAGTAVASR